MAAKKRSPGSTPPSQRPQRAGSAELAKRDLPVWPDRVFGAKPIHSLERLGNQLRDQNPHGNPDLFLYDVFVAYLLAFFNPPLRTLRTLTDLSRYRQHSY